jgi:4-hydroxyproline epimerase
VIDFPATVEVVDSHTEGEPTRVVVAGWSVPDAATMSDHRATVARQHSLRRAVVCEPRGHDAIVGALLVPPVDPSSLAGVVFFNNAGTLAMCGHGLIGVVRTLEHLGRFAPGRGTVDTPAGTIPVTLDEDGSVTIENVRSYRILDEITLDVPAVGRVTGDVAWGGNWFYITGTPGIELSLANVPALTAATTAIRRALEARAIVGDDGSPVDHVELFGPPRRPDADSRNFVLCPGLAYDRSPCGTGTSAKMACLAARGELAVGTLWRQESITGSIFTGWLEERDGALVPLIRGRAFVTGRATLYFDPLDPFREGIGTQ